MKISIILLGLLIITQCTALESDQLQQEKDLLKKLRDTDSLGKNIMETIELELSSGTDEHILDRVISMLHELLDSLSAQQADQKVEVETKNTECGEKFKDLRAEV